MLTPVARGATDEPIARGLRTGEAAGRTHLRHVVGSPGVDDRTAPATAALERGAPLSEHGPRR